MEISMVGCLHGHKPVLPGGDLLIVTGDLTARDRPEQYLVFREWLMKQDYRRKIFIAGNHDGCLESGHFYFSSDWMGAEYLCDSGTTFDGLKIWGSPWSSRFDGINPHCCAFTKADDKDLADKFNLIPEGTDILITHCPPWGILDENTENFNCGSHALRMAVEFVKPKIHVFSHIHENGGRDMMLKHAGPNTLCINCSVMDERYIHTHKIMNIKI